MTGEDWVKVKTGFVILANDRFVWAIIANGHPEKPVIYYTSYLWEAKAWKDMKAALKARNRLQAQGVDCEVHAFKYDEEAAARILVGMVD